MINQFYGRYTESKEALAVDGILTVDLNHFMANFSFKPLLISGNSEKSTNVFAYIA